MITIEDKIESFKKIINEDIKEKYDNEIQNIILENEKIIKEYEAKKSLEIDKLKKDYALKLESKI